MRKQDGWYVLWDQGESQKHIVIESPYFEPVTARLPVGEIQKKKQPSIRICLIPNRNYPFPGQIGWIKGKAAPGSLVEGILEGSAGLLKLVKDYHPEGGNGKQLSVRYGRELEPEGLTFAIRSLDRGSWEPFVIWEKDPFSGICSLRTPLEQAYSVNNSEICLRWQTKAGSDGGYVLPEHCTYWRELEKGEGYLWDFVSVEEPPSHVRLVWPRQC